MMIDIAGSPTISPWVTADRALKAACDLKAPHTARAYRSAWKLFAAFCLGRSLCPLPAAPDTVVLYLQYRERSKRGHATLSRDLAAISQVHQAADLDSPTKGLVVTREHKRIRRRIGTASKSKAALVLRDLRRVLAICPDDLSGLRDRALLLIGWAAALRRSELASLNVDDIDRTEDGIVLCVRRGKTDQEGRGLEKGIPLASDPTVCPVLALEAWISAARVRDGALLRAVRGRSVGGRLDPEQVCAIIQTACARAGLNAARYGGHSLRSGLATSAAMAGAEERVIMEHTGHKSAAVVRRYIRRGSLFARNPLSGLL